MPPLKKAPSSIEMRAAITSPVSEPSLRMSTRSDAWQLPRTFPSTTISRAEMFAATWPFRPTVTRLPGRLIAPSTLPSMYSDSDPVSSPLTTKLLPMVACSPVALAPGAPAVVVRGASKPDPPVTGGVGRLGSGVGGVALPGWFGFHILSNFLSVWGKMFAPETAATLGDDAAFCPDLRPRYYFVNGG